MREIGRKKIIESEIICKILEEKKVKGKKSKFFLSKRKKKYVYKMT